MYGMHYKKRDNMREIPLSVFLTRNRSEEQSERDDLWGLYVLPLNYKSLLHYKKSNHITGGRGVGKTTYIQYHCYSTRFSNNRDDVNETDFENIGLYFKPDSSLLSDMTINSVGEKLWKPIFHAYIGFAILYELSRFLKYFSDSKHCDLSTKQEISKLTIPKETSEMLGIKEQNILFVDLYDKIKILSARLNNWLCFSTEIPPFAFNAKTMISLHIELIHQISTLKNVKFHVFIDEFENISNEHQRIINSWIKHVDKDVIYHVTYKKHYEPTYDTDGLEKIQERNDFRVIDIERDLLSDTYHTNTLTNNNDFKLLCAEIIINNLQAYFKEKLVFLSEFDDDYLSKQSYIKQRKNIKYKELILKAIEKILPANTLSDISNELMNDNPLKNKVYESIQKSLEYKKCNTFTLNDFLDSNNHGNTILNAILLNRDKDCEYIYNQYISKSYEYRHWKDINHLSSLLYFYTKFNHKTCSYYGGYERFIIQSWFNTRHLLELFHKSILELEKQNIDFNSINDIEIPTQIQAKAAREVSTFEFNRKISSCGKHGLSLKKITERLGKLFALKQLDPAQSIAEVTQFSIIYSSKQGNLNNEMMNTIDSLLNELKMWSIIIEKDNTKLNNKLENNSLKEYRLHPILSSYFQISPRQKRKFEFDIDTIQTIFLSNNNKDFEILYEKMSKSDVKKQPDLSDVKKQPDLLDYIYES